MDQGSIIIGAILLATLVLPLVILNRSTKNREKQLLKKLQAPAQPHHDNITQYDCWSDSAIGLDDKTGKLFFYRKVGDHESTSQISLSDMQGCRVIQSGTHRPTEKLQLAFLPKAKGKPEIVLEFFDIEYDLQLNRERELVEKWAGIVKEQLLRG